MLENLKAYNSLYDATERKKLVAQSIKQLRVQANYKKEDVAEYVGVKVSTYTAYESGRNEPPIEFIVRISILYDVPIDVIVQRDNYNKNALNAVTQLENYEQQIKELKIALENKDENAQKSLSPLLETLEQLNSTIQDFAKKQD